MVTHTKGQKYILSASISHEVGKVLDERNKVHGIIKSFEVEQALRLYYGLKNVQGSKGSTPTTQAPPRRRPPTPTTINTITTDTGTPAAGNFLSNMTTDEAPSLGGVEVADANRKKVNSIV